MLFHNIRYGIFWMKEIMNKKQGTLDVGYIPEMDRTVIFLKKENSTEVVGWYYGGPNEKNTEYFSKGKKSLTAHYTM